MNRLKLTTLLPLFLSLYTYAQNTFPATGSVGIGLNVPRAQLHIFGQNQTTASLSTVTGLGGALYLQDSGGGYGSGGSLLFGVGQGAFAAIKSLGTNGDGNVTGDLAFSTRNHISDANLTERMRILSNGNIGIGTSSPDAKLTINGTIHSREVKVDLNIPAPDFVFEKKFNLMPLEEVNQYIVHNKHLPAIPSADEIEKNGISLGEMNMKLLQKIEELTLYIIQMKAEIKDLQHSAYRSPIGQYKRPAVRRAKSMYNRNKFGSKRSLANP